MPAYGPKAAHVRMVSSRAAGTGRPQRQRCLHVRSRIGLAGRVPLGPGEWHRAPPFERASLVSTLTHRLFGLCAFFRYHIVHLLGNFTIASAGVRFSGLCLIANVVSLGAGSQIANILSWNRSARSLVHLTSETRVCRHAQGEHPAPITSSRQYRDSTSLDV